MGPEFARLHPDIAGLLAHPGSDPDVERLLQGVAFLCGRVRRKLDDDLPELTTGVMSLLWPHYLRPIPSMTIMEFTPKSETMQGPQEVAAGAEFASTCPKGGTACRYRSCWPCMIRPWRIREARLDAEPARPVRLVLNFESSSKVPLEQLGLDRVRLFLAGDPQVSFLLYLLLSQHVQGVTVSDDTAPPGGPCARLEPAQVRASGLDQAEGVLPFEGHSFSGYRLLQEYFAFKNRFLFIDLLGLDRAVAEVGATRSLLVEVAFDHRPEVLPLVSAEHLRLHCVPAVNLVRCAAEPIRLQHERTRYLVQPASARLSSRSHWEVYSIDQVVGITHGQGATQREYLPFHAFRNPAGSAEQSRFYQASVEPNVEDGDLRRGTDTYISFAGAGLEPWAGDEVVSVELTCTNRQLPEQLQVGDVTQATDSSPAAATFRNIVKPTPTIAPPLGDGLHWRLIAHLTLNRVSLADAVHFRNLLRVYDFQSQRDARKAVEHQRLLEGIESLASRTDQRLIRGAPVRGTRVEMTLSEDHFAGEGDACLFAGILDRFMGLYASVNSYTQTAVRFDRCGRTYEFPVRWGEQITPARMS